MRTLSQDIRHSLRLLRRTPGFSFFVVIALGLGIGTNTALFTVVNNILLQPLPFSQPDELVEISTGARAFPLEDLRRGQSFSAVGLRTRNIVHWHNSRFCPAAPSLS